MICCICKQEIKDGYGHNPAPFPVEWPEQRCCDICNYGVVLPLRLEKIDYNNLNNDEDGTSKIGQ